MSISSDVFVHQMGSFMQPYELFKLRHVNRDVYHQYQNAIRSWLFTQDALKTAFENDDVSLLREIVSTQGFSHLLNAMKDFDFVFFLTDDISKRDEMLKPLRIFDALATGSIVDPSTDMTSKEVLALISAPTQGSKYNTLQQQFEEQNEEDNVTNMLARYIFGLAYYALRFNPPHGKTFGRFIYDLYEGDHQRALDLVRVSFRKSPSGVPFCHLIEELNVNVPPSVAQEMINLLQEEINEYEELDLGGFTGHYEENIDCLQQFV